MRLAEGIRRHGFRKWYERELLQGHAHLVLCFFCVIGIFAAIDGGGGQRAAGERLADLATLLLCVATGIWALRRYLGLLASAEAVANQADCPQCGTYGRLELVQSDATGSEVQVRCRHCGHAWHISG